MTDQNLKVTLIITTYNREDALELTLLSILNQSQLPDEIIIADDGSDKKTRNLIEKYKLKTLVPLRHCWHEDKGFRASSIRNKAIKMAASDYLIMVDGDMIMQKYFIQDHKQMARKSTLVQGKRVLLDERLTKKALQISQLTFNFFSPGISNRLNMLHLPSISNWIKGPNHPLKGVRTCNMAFWRADAFSINGFNEAFVGWGREDSEFVVRMENAGIKRLNFKFGAIAFHLHHKLHPRTNLRKNDLLLEKAMQSKSTWCEKGIK